MGAQRKFTALLAVLLSILIVTVALLAWPSQVSAQCGSSASSCKNCHEVQGEYPVNASGDWHISHAFGDFCEFCHAGNVQATEAEAAHTGMVYPLADVNASCLSCHPDDVTQKAEVYAVALGVTVGTGSTDGGDATGGAAPQEPEVDQQPAVEEQPVEPVATQGEIVDYNSQYARTVLDERAPLNAGNLVLTFLAFGFTVLGGSLVWRWEGLGERWRMLRGQPGGAATLPGRRTFAPQPLSGALREADSPAYDALSPEMAALVEKLDAPAVRALQRLFGDAQFGSQVVQAMATLDPQLVRQVAQLDARDRNLLMALATSLSDETAPPAV